MRSLEVKTGMRKFIHAKRINSQFCWKHPRKKFQLILFHKNCDSLGMGSKFYANFQCDIRFAFLLSRDDLHSVGDGWHLRQKPFHRLTAIESNGFLSGPRNFHQRVKAERSRSGRETLDKDFSQQSQGEFHSIERAVSRKWFRRRQTQDYHRWKSLREIGFMEVFPILII